MKPRTARAFYYAQTFDQPSAPTWEDLTWEGQESWKHAFVSTPEEKLPEEPLTFKNVQATPKAPGVRPSGEYKGGGPRMTPQDVDKMIREGEAAMAEEVKRRGDPSPDMVNTTWRTGRKLGRTVYRQLGNQPSDDDPFLGMFDSAEIAALVCQLVNCASQLGGAS